MFSEWGEKAAARQAQRGRGGARHMQSHFVNNEWQIYVVKHNDRLRLVITVMCHNVYEMTSLFFGRVTNI